MNNTMDRPEAASAYSGPSTIEIIIALLALFLALAAVVVGIAQYLQARAAKRRQMDLEAGQTDTELMPTTTSHRSNTDSIAINPK
jgi:hypothetical protein